jgi:hypothetical protein
VWRDTDSLPLLSLFSHFLQLNQLNNDLSECNPDWSDDSFRRLVRCAAISNDAFFPMDKMKGRPFRSIKVR